MRRTSRSSLGVVLAAALATVVSLPAAAAPVGGSLTSASPAPVQDFLRDELADLDLSEQTTVLVHGTDLAAADHAVRVAGLTEVPAPSSSGYRR